MPFKVGNNHGKHTNHARGFKCRNLALLKDMRWVHKNGIAERVPSPELENRLANGWTHGRPTPSEEARRRMSESQIARTDKVFAAPDARLNTWYKCRYNRSTQEFNDLFLEQGNHCALCPSAGTKKRRLCWDHNHTCCPGIKACGKCVRGLLCIKCNNKMGHLEQMINDGLVTNATPGTWLEKALAYLLRYQIDNSQLPPPV